MNTTRCMVLSNLNSVQIQTHSQIGTGLGGIGGGTNTSQAYYGTGGPPTEISMMVNGAYNFPGP